MDISTGWPSLISTHGYIHGNIHGYPYPRQPCVGFPFCQRRFSIFLIVLHQMTYTLVLGRGYLPAHTYSKAVNLTRLLKHKFKICCLHFSDFTIPYRLFVSRCFMKRTANVTTEHRSVAAMNPPKG